MAKPIPIGKVGRKNPKVCLGSPEKMEGEDLPVQQLLVARSQNLSF